MVSGATKFSYWTANYLVDIVSHFIPGLVARFCVWWLEMDVPQCEVVFFVFSLVNPPFIYALSFLFDSDFKASVIVRVLYFAIGGAGPIAMQIL
jgi:hypothetical protein